MYHQVVADERSLLCQIASVIDGHVPAGERHEPLDLIPPAATAKNEGIITVVRDDMREGQGTAGGLLEEAVPKPTDSSLICADTSQYAWLSPQH